MAQWNKVDSELEQIIDIAARLKGSVGEVKRDVDSILQTRDADLKAFESSFFPAGGAPILAKNIPPAPPAPTNLNVRSRPLNLKTRNWGDKLENGYSGINRSLYDRPKVFYWDSEPLLHASTKNNNNLSNIPQAPRLPQWNNLRSGNLIRGKKLRTRSWGNPVQPFGWSGMDRELYNREGGLNLELNVIVNELWAKLQPKNPIGSNNMAERALPQQLPQQQFIQQQPQFVQQFIQPQPVKNSMFSTVTTTHVVPLNNSNMGTATILTPAAAALNRIPSQKELKQQQKLLKKQNKKNAKLAKKGVLQPTTIAAAPVAPMTLVGGSPALVGGFNNTNSFIKQDPFINNTNTLPLVGSPMM